MDKFYAMRSLGIIHEFSLIEFVYIKRFSFLVFLLCIIFKIMIGSCINC